MSDEIKHECGIAFLRLKKPISYYKKKYGSHFWALNKLYLLMEKQHNRGQDGAGLVAVKFNPKPGTEFIFRERSIDSRPIVSIFKNIQRSINDAREYAKELQHDENWIEDYLPFVGDIYLGHLRYGTYGQNSIHQCHPFIRKNNWIHRNLITAGNFNMTNVDELFNQLINLGQHPREKADTLTILERIGHFLDEDVNDIYYKLKEQGFSKKTASPHIEKLLNIKRILKRSAKKWDGGYAMVGIFGHGDAFVLRDPNGIRPAFYYENEEFITVTSERPVIQTVFNVDFNDIKEVEPGCALIIKKNGIAKMERIKPAQTKLSCSFERIYFSRGSDKDIYRERIELGKNVVPKVMEAIDNEIDNSVFSFIPNTAENAFYGLIKGLEDYHNELKIEKIKNIVMKGDDKELREILSKRVRIEKVAIKDVKLRTFITEDNERDELVEHVYDVTYGTVKSNDNLVVIDDSIVRGTTLKKSIIKILDRLKPKRIVIVSSAPQIRYPDCYGIDMAKLGDFIAFRAAIELLKERNMNHIIDDVYQKCKNQIGLEDVKIVNYVKEIYAPFTEEEISDKISDLVKDPIVNAEVKVVYQSIEGLHKSVPNHLGDWYFSGNYPTAGGNRVVNKSFIYYYEGKNQRAY
jgi:amidophosphoribosyltransferase